MTTRGEGRLAPALVADLYARHATELRSFLVGIVRDREVAEDLLQATFAKAAEQGHQARPDAIRAWLYRVAYNEAMVRRRREGTEERSRKHLVWRAVGAGDSPQDAAERAELRERVRVAIDSLAPEQAVVVRLRIYDQLPFAEIARRLQIPLGTALTRMQSALARLEQATRSYHERGKG